MFDFVVSAMFCFSFPLPVFEQIFGRFSSCMSFDSGSCMSIAFYFRFDACMHASLFCSRLVAWTQQDRNSV